ncbi:MAG: hypothetical protein EXR50_01235 [Dehalococcoidia bacterium]|nr:hypothetical protein [Dehalococcoidia bacterium]
MQSAIFVDVEAGDNCPYSLQSLFSRLDAPREVIQVRLYLGPGEGALYDVTGWCEDGPCPALGAKVEDSGQGYAFLVYGGESGLRYRPAGSAEAWSLDASDQWGDSHLLLSEVTDISWAKL